MKILNTEKEDYHVHSLNYSDGMNTVDEVVKFAGKLGMKKLVFTDHSQKGCDYEGIPFQNFRLLVLRWKNVHNDVEVVFGVEADLLNEKGDICDDIQGMKGDFTILSYHDHVYKGDIQNLTQAFINAIERHHDKIDCIGHIFIFVKEKEIDAEKIIETANKYNIPFEFNVRYITSGKEYSDMDILKTMLSKANSIYVNSDAHTLAELRDLRKIGFEYLKENRYID